MKVILLFMEFGGGEMYLNLCMSNYIFKQSIRESKTELNYETTSCDNSYGSYRMYFAYYFLLGDSCLLFEELHSSFEQKTRNFIEDIFILLKASEVISP